jgi:hypothetical protein
VKVIECGHEGYRLSFEDILFTFKKPSVDEDLHFIANGYANAWYINHKTFDKNGDNKLIIIIYFEQQSYAYLGMLISLSTLCICAVCLFINSLSLLLKRNRKILYLCRLKRLITLLLPNKESM